MLQLPCVVAVGVRSAWCSPCHGNPQHGAGSTKLGVRPAHWCSTHPDRRPRVSAGSEQAVLENPILSQEARAADPSPPASLPVRTRHCPRLQTVVLGTGPVDSLREELADRYLQGVPVPVLHPGMDARIGVEGPRSGH